MLSRPEPPPVLALDPTTGVKHNALSICGVITLGGLRMRNTDGDDEVYIGGRVAWLREPPPLLVGLVTGLPARDEPQLLLPLLIRIGTGVYGSSFRLVFSPCWLSFENSWNGNADHGTFPFPSPALPGVGSFGGGDSMTILNPLPTSPCSCCRSAR